MIIKALKNRSEYKEYRISDREFRARLRLHFIPVAAASLPVSSIFNALP